jgi:hypothetical protein
MSHLDSQTIQLFIIAIAGLAVVMQACVLLAIFLSIKKAVTAAQTEVADLRAVVMPILRTSQELLARVAPNIESTTADVAEMVHGFRERIAIVESSTTEIVERLDRQTARVDTMVTGVLDSLERAGGYVSDAVKKPLQQLAGMMAAIKAVVETLRASQAEPTPPASSDDSNPAD